MKYDFKVGQVYRMQTGGDSFEILSVGPNYVGWKYINRPSGVLSEILHLSTGNYTLVKPKIKKWLNIYAGGSIMSYLRREDADHSAYTRSRIACIEIEFEEGQGL